MDSLGPYALDEVHLGDCREALAKMRGESVHCIVTSPPYWGLRNYGTGPQLWPDGWRGELGLEPTPELYVQHLTLIFHECFRVLRSDGTLWLNLGDTYATTGGRGEVRMAELGRPSENAIQSPVARGLAPGTKLAPGLKPKDLVGIPWMVAFSLRSDGWYLRQEIIWHKPNPMPESVQDRCTKAHESIFLFSKSPCYFYDHLAIAEPAQYAEQHANKTTSWGTNRKHPNKANVADYAFKGDNHTCLAGGMRNRRSVWTIATVPYPEAHYAVFPPAIPRLCILAGTSAKGCCPTCQAPYDRIIEKRAASITKPRPFSKPGNERDRNDVGRIYEEKESVTTGWQPTCHCGGEPVPCVVLDPFAGSGTTLAVAIELERNYIGIELDPKNLPLIERRCDPVRKRLAAAKAQGKLSLEN